MVRYSKLRVGLCPWAAQSLEISRVLPLMKFFCQLDLAPVVPFPLSSDLYQLYAFVRWRGIVFLKNVSQVSKNILGVIISVKCALI